MSTWMDIGYHENKSYKFLNLQCFVHILVICGHQMVMRRKTLIKSLQGSLLGHVICMTSSNCHQGAMPLHEGVVSFSKSSSIFSSSEGCTSDSLVKNSGFLNLSISSHNTFYENLLMMLLCYYKSYLQKYGSMMRQDSYGITFLCLYLCSKRALRIQQLRNLFWSIKAHDL